MVPENKLHDCLHAKHGVHNAASREPKYTYKYNAQGNIKAVSQ